MLEGPLLIAGRGEIAVRVARTARRLGLATVAVFSDADEDAEHVRAADVAVRVGPAPAQASYLDIEALLDAARRTGARAVHPGYGFLSESPAFARAVTGAGLTWVGPPAAAIELMGDKARAKACAREAGVPTIPGAEGEVGLAGIQAFCAEHGFPAVIKAVAGGGGRGMRVVRAERELAGALDAARREAQAAFGDDRVLVERYLEHTRHVEVQVLADRHGGCVHLGERECSLQRRHQKVVEEAPSPAVGDALRAAMGDAAVALARAAGYEGAGTVELVLGRDGAFFFLEMNTRLQVEHPVTEAVFGVDLVEEQLRIAAGEPLALRQPDVRPRGHAIEARVYAEDPSTGFLPSGGRIAAWQAPAGEGVRVDAGVRAGTEVTGHYDPLLAKVIAHGPDRATALRRLDRALAGTTVLGVATSIAFTRALLADPGVRAGEMDTGLLERRLPELVGEPPEDLLAAAALAAWLRDTAALGGRVGAWRRSYAGHGELVIDDGVLTAGERSWQVRALFEEDGVLRAALDGISRRYAIAQRDGTVWAGRDGYALEARPAVRDRSDHAHAGEALEAPMPGTVLLVHVTEGDHVDEGDVLLVLESMKMELAITAPHAGVVEHLRLAPGDRVGLREPLVTIGAKTSSSLARAPLSRRVEGADE
jgi:acetyl-CoA/propionyl-CoA carboxylase, biotin carboxylase, biotin carboxyl carrier protein